MICEPLAKTKTFCRAFVHPLLFTYVKIVKFTFVHTQIKVYPPLQTFFIVSIIRMLAGEDNFLHSANNHSEGLALSYGTLASEAVLISRRFATPQPNILKTSLSKEKTKHCTLWCYQDLFNNLRDLTCVSLFLQTCYMNYRS